MKFYSIGADDKKGAVEIKTKVDFASNIHIPFDSLMITNNQFKITKGKKLFDVIGFADSALHFAISKRFKQLLEDYNIKGWTCFPIVIQGTEQEYFVFQPTFVAGEILNLEKVNKYEEQIKFDVPTWDGSGVFTLKNTVQIVCTEEVKNLIEDKQITNVHLHPL